MSFGRKAITRDTFVCCLGGLSILSCKAKKNVSAHYTSSPIQPFDLLEQFSGPRVLASLQIQFTFTIGKCHDFHDFINSDFIKLLLLFHLLFLSQTTYSSHLTT